MHRSMRSLDACGRMRQLVLAMHGALGPLRLRAQARPAHMNQHCTIDVIARTCCNLRARGGKGAGSRWECAAARAVLPPRGTAPLPSTCPRPPARPESRYGSTQSVTARLPATRDAPLAALLAERVDAQRDDDLDREKAQSAYPVTHAAALAPAERCCCVCSLPQHQIAGEAKP